jgi:hypothetical protein
MQTVTLQLPEALYRIARQVAETTQQPLETVLQNSIAYALPPLDDVPPEEAAALSALALLDDATLWREADMVMSPIEQTELQNLLDSQGEGDLSPIDAARLETLLDIYGRLTVRKAHAWLLLARRGYRVPVQSNQA